ncbi:uncharacterized protein LOC128982874 [Macrosteles quadrilineatus]|uniref:uncharacterized protein LOC128982874 n=1 Tax=Macrosteles quadrilineatus TaxID=74068 RepID=UPI0023E2F39F|nr:uncharacterized protein LOC128982874 [Macrosteles quadrilineatus]
MSSVLCVTLYRNDTQILHRSKEIKQNNLRNIIDGLKDMQANINQLLTDLVNNCDGKIGKANQEMEMEGDGGEDDEEDDSIISEDNHCDNSQKKKNSKDTKRNYKRRKTCL